ncbi:MULTISPECIES: GAF domain-containing protein [Carnobacterium]|uniref:Histidine kinase n=1 Tax=Carnobacterium divergens TaxID=2748 RepID=A0A2R8A186_CARDV|nr:MULTISPECIES: GAF domain-containing protein [Carnobacterium]MCO6017490.1 GAF domain-containing protein [Carnobacterium divergens]MDT1939143.1 GAF domain-containing protein [Carnobacterium divergens]MDT1941581.1 GAF domain-containing protein [Carnobacterium divergens]MDT1947379.1 GAF domain-containing protein [Carnobacterium divergens]MDT1949818.1 GAF domain-containing protein [Carnobacterium divergens]
MSKKGIYQLTNAQLEAIIGDETNLIANLSNASALLFENLPDINWAGFYLYEVETDELVLGPFQGKVACIRIKNGRGVCGTAFAKNESVVVDNVHDFPGHIACDAKSQSEIVIPLMKNGKTIGVLDVDAPITNRFDEIDRGYLEDFVLILLANSSI